MSANTLNNRSIGQTILDTFFNDIHSALDGDFVGRGATGIPTSGQNLGTLALPWGTAYVTTLNIAGSSLDTSKVSSPANRVISGKKRTTSNQPAFLTPNGAAASVLIAGATTNLNLSIGGASVSVTTDITKGSLTTAPSSQNTATVNDAAAAAQADTKQWGEYWGKKITITSAGTNITSLVGKFAAFKIVHSAVTEYFVAYVESSTVLSHCMRGFFYDSSLNPVNPVAISNSDTITLMKAGFVFMTNDATTVDVSYTFPVYASSSPSSPVTGDYWFDTINLVWKRYDGASFQIINRTLIGMVVMDSTNCVAARCEDFYAAYSQNNTLDLEISSTATIILPKRQGMGVNVAGLELTFGKMGSLPSWVGANNYVTSADYYAVFGASATYYLYIKDDATPIISDIAPIYRADLYGYYNRHNPWRCVGKAATDGSSNWLWISGMPKSPVISPEYSNVSLYGGNGYGSTNTKIRRFTTVGNNQGTSLLLTQSATLGDSITVQESGLYSICYGDLKTSGGATIGVTRNATAPTVTVPNPVAGLPETLMICIYSDVSPATVTLADMFWLNAGDIIRAHTDGGPVSTAMPFFHMTRIA